MKEYKYRIVAFLSCFMMYTSILHSQESDTNDFELWSSVGVSYSVNDKFKVGLKEQLRLKENATTTDTYFTDLSLEYELFTDFEIGLVGLRHITRK